MTLNRGPNSTSYDDPDESMSSSFHDSISDATHSSTVSISKTGKNTSPSKTDFTTTMHIVPPSELLRLGEVDHEESRPILSPKFGGLSEMEDLLHGDFEDMSTNLRDPEGSTWLTELGAHPGLSPFNPRTTSMMPIYKGKEPAIGQGLPPPMRGLARPSTGTTRRDSSNSKVSSIYTQGRRPSTSQASSGVSGVRGGPLSPPPLRSRLPRSSISSSMRSIPGITHPVGPPNPLAPPPSRSRANSSSTLPAHPTSVKSQPRRGSEMSNPPVKESTPTPIPVPDGFGELPDRFALNKKLSLLGTSAQRKKRISLKPSFLDIDFEEDDDGMDAIRNPAESRLIEDSFLDLSRGNSMDSMRE